MPPDCCEVDPAEEERIPRVALELALVLEDSSVSRRERNKDARGEGEAFARRQRQGDRWVRVYLIRRGRFWDST